MPASPAATAPDEHRQRVLLVGASGLVGQGVLRVLQAADDVAAITCLVRRRLDIAHPKVSQTVLPDFANAAAHAGALGDHDVLLYCAGARPFITPEDEYRRVTVDLTLAVAQAYASVNPQGRIVYVSGAHAHAASRFMPMRIKAQAEHALQALPLHTVMLRPGGIAPAQGERSPHAAMRMLYALGAGVMQLSTRLLPSAMTDTATLGRAMLAVMRMATPPTVVENRQINTLGRA